MLNMAANNISEVSQTMAQLMGVQSGSGAGKFVRTASERAG